jgi:hypothetical protein
MRPLGSLRALSTAKKGLSCTECQGDSCRLHYFRSLAWPPLRLAMLRSFPAGRPSLTGTISDFARKAAHAKRGFACVALTLRNGNAPAIAKRAPGCRPSYKANSSGASRWGQARLATDGQDQQTGIVLSLSVSLMAKMLPAVSLSEV